MIIQNIFNGDIQSENDKNLFCFILFILKEFSLVHQFNLIIPYDIIRLIILLCYKLVDYIDKTIIKDHNQLFNKNLIQFTKKHGHYYKNIRYKYSTDENVSAYFAVKSHLKDLNLLNINKYNNNLIYVGEYNKIHCYGLFQRFISLYNIQRPDINKFTPIGRPLLSLSYISSRRVVFELDGTYLPLKKNQNGVLLSYNNAWEIKKVVVELKVIKNKKPYDRITALVTKSYSMKYIDGAIINIKTFYFAIYK